MIRVAAVVLALVAVSGSVLLSGGRAIPQAGFYKPNLAVDSTSTALRARGDLTVSFYATNRGEGVPNPDDPTAIITVYAPRGYSARLGQRVETRIGSASAKYEARSRGGKVLNLTGSVRVADPRAHLDDACAPGLHDAVWLLSLDLLGQILDIPVYVDALDPASTGSSYRLRLCLPSPDVPVERGGAPLQGRFFALAYVVKDIWRNPARSGTYAWSGVFTPYDSAVPAPSREVEARSIELLPVKLSLRGTRRGDRGGDVRIFGAVTAAGQRFSKAKVRLFAGATPRRLSPVRELRVRGNGSFRLVLPAPRRKMFYRAGTEFSAFVPCPPPSRAPAGCVSATTGFFDVTSPLIKV